MTHTTFKQRLTGGLLGLLVALGSVAPQAAWGNAELYNQTLKATTWILAKNSEGTSSGTGVLVDKERKLVITNAHVVGDARATVLFFAETKENGRPETSRSHYLTNVRKLGIRGRVIAVDRKRDLALVELDRLPESAEQIEMAEDSVGPGEEVDSIGNPGSTDALWVYTKGSVKAVYKKQFRTGAGEHDFMVVETTSPINSGDSGGPVVDRNGKLIAISQAIAPKARSVSYSVDITEIKAFMSGPWKLAPLPITEVLEKTELTFEKHESGHYQLELDGSGDEKQLIFVTKDIEYYERADIRKIWSLAYAGDTAPTAETLMKLMQQNARTKLGSWTIEQTPEGQYLLVYVVKIDATATPDALKSSMEYVAKLTSAMKKELEPQKEAASASDTLNEWLAN